MSEQEFAAMEDWYKRKGPNRLKKGTSYKTSDRNEAVKIRVGKEGVEAAEPISIPSLMERTARNYPDHPALVYPDENNVWETLTYAEYHAKVLKIAKAFIKLGLEERHAVGVLAFNCPQWFYSELASITANGINAGIYTTNSADAVYHVLLSSNANIVVVDDSKQMEKIRQIRHKLPMLKAAIQINAPYEPYVKREDGYYRWSEIEEFDLDEYEDELQKRLENIAVNECCSLVYTSGTVGNPKGVMLNHDSMTWNAYTLASRLPNLEYSKEVLVTYLPLSHIAAQVVDILMSLTYAATVYFADKDALKGTIAETMKIAKPTRFLAVPRVYEKFYEKLDSVLSQSSGFARILTNWARNASTQYYMDKIEGRENGGWQYWMAKSLVFSKIREKLGFTNCHTIVSAAAPLSPELKKFFVSLDMPIMEAFGMSETCAHTVSTIDSFNFDSIGKCLVGTETSIKNPDENGHGEICMRGRHIFMGYIGEPEKTNEALDDEGWLHSGDIGYIDENDMIYITGRIKELIITAGGENIPPVHIENLVKNELRAVSNALLIGDKRKFLSMLIAIKTDMNGEGAPTDRLHPDSIAWMKSLDVGYTTLSQILAAGPCKKVVQSIKEGIERYNKSAISNAQRIQKFKILPHDFSVPTGELGPTLKIKRNVVVDMYHNIIEEMYK